MVIYIYAEDSIKSIFYDDLNRNKSEVTKQNLKILMELLMPRLARTTLKLNVQKHGLRTMNVYGEKINAIFIEICDEVFLWPRNKG